jgi:hypothetical protein
MNTRTRAVLAMGLAVGLSGVAGAATPSTGLGQAWPNATDVSLNPQYHAYLFVRDGIRYVQINDAGGTVLAALATAGNSILVLPIGVDASHVSTATAQRMAVSSTTNTVYQDSTVSVSVTVQPNGSLQILATPRTQAQPCTDPGECSNVVASPQ